MLYYIRDERKLVKRLGIEARVCVRIITELINREKCVYT